MSLRVGRVASREETRLPDRRPLEQELEDHVVVLERLRAQGPEEEPGRVGVIRQAKW